MTKVILILGTPAIFSCRLPEWRSFGEAVADGSFQATHRPGLPAGKEFEALRPNRNRRGLGTNQAWSNFRAIRSSRSRCRGEYTLDRCVFTFDAKAPLLRRIALAITVIMILYGTIIKYL